jgi:peroxiredoxin
VTTSAADEMTAAAERRWLDTWTAGPTEPEGSGLPAGAKAPELRLVDHTGATRNLSDLWADGPALLMFWRHFGCGCGVERAARLRKEYDAYRAVGLQPVVVAQGEPERAAAYHDEHSLPCPVLCDPELMAYRAYGVGQWPVERILYDAPAEFWTHERDIGRAFQDRRRESGRPLVDDPWRATAEFVIGRGGLIRLSYLYQYCEDFPDPRLLTAAARLS